MTTNNLIGYIYILASPSGKRYVGQTVTSIEQRMHEHWSEAKRGWSFPLHNAIRKYGKDNIDVLHSFPVYGEQGDLDAAEDQYILQYNTLVPSGYNIRRGGSHGAHSEETKTRMSAAHKGKVLSEEHKSKISMTLKGQCHSEEHKVKISAALMGHLGYWTGKQGPNKGKSSPTKGRPRSQEIRAKLLASHRGKCLSKDTIAKRTATRKMNRQMAYELSRGEEKE